MAWFWWLMGGVPLLLVAGLIGLVVYNNQFRLTAEKLEAAKARWRDAGIRNYQIKVEVSGGTTGSYVVDVRDGAIHQATLNGKPFAQLDQAEPWTVPGLFQVLERDLENDAKPGSPATYTKVRFDPQDGHPIRYVRSSQNQHVIIETTVTPTR